MIPRKIHYCWFGGKPKPPLALRCIASWKKHLPGYHFIEWNETNYEVTSNRYMREAYESKKWAFVSDYARLAVLYEHGGIYLDVDVEVMRSLDRFLLHRVFTGFEAPDSIPTGIIGAERQHPWIGQLLLEYEKRCFILCDGTMDLTTNVEAITTNAIGRGLKLGGAYQVLEGDVHIYPPEWFCPIDYNSAQMKCTENTHCIHHFYGSWKPRSSQMKHRVVNFLRKHFGPLAVSFFVHLKRRLYSFIRRGYNG